MNAFCTIVDESHIPFAKALYSSVAIFHPDCTFFILVTDLSQTYVDPVSKTIHWLAISDIRKAGTIDLILKKYLHKTQKDELRWALKPALIGWLLSQGMKKVIYADADIFFVNSAEFLFDELDRYSLILTPHWRDIKPGNNNDLFYSLTSGYFNAGFVGASSNSMNVIKWWEEACSFRMEKSIKYGLFDDQKFLDLVPLEFDGVGIIKHKGCNIAIWNLDTNKREMVGNKLLINGKYDPVFIHFTKDTIQNIVLGNDRLLYPLLENYKAALGTDFFVSHFNVDKSNSPQKQNYFIYIKGKLLIRTRIKRFLYLLSEWL